MSEESLFNYAGDGEPPEFFLRQPVFHPYQPGTVIGHTVAIMPADRLGAVFPRTPEDHYFRKHDGYAVSIQTLNYIQQQGARLVYVYEREQPPGQDRGKYVFEYDIAAFGDGPLVAYSPEYDTVIEGEENVQKTSDTSFSDAQRVAPTDLARRKWPTDEVNLER